MQFKHKAASSTASILLDESLPAVMLMRARVAHGEGKHAEAQAAYKKVLKKSANNFAALHFLGLSEYECGKYEDAIRHLKRAVLAEPHSAEARSDLGVALSAAKRFDEALAAWDKAAALNPDLAAAHSNRASALMTLCRYEDAISSFDKALSLAPGLVGIWCDRGNALRKLRRYSDAIESYDKAVAIDPRNAIAHYNRGVTLKLLGQLDEALASFDAALCSGEQTALAGIARAETLFAQQKITEALATALKVVEIEPHSTLALTLLGNCLAALGEQDGAIPLYDRALAIEPDNHIALSCKIFALDFVASADFVSQQEARAEWWKQIGSHIYKALAAPHSNDRNPDRRLVLGYVSGDFREHSAGHVFLPILEHHDKKHFEVVCYSTAIATDTYTDLYHSAADKWRDVSQLTDDQIAACIRHDKVDILIDLSGHTEGSRLMVFARKPAPVQVTAWGHATGTGLKSIDYLFADPVAIPAEVRPLHAERIYDLPCLLTLATPPARLRSIEPPLARNGYLTYGVFNRVAKMGDHSIDVWAQILLRNPTSRMILKSNELDDLGRQENLLNKFAARNVPLERLQLMGRTTRDEHLEMLQQIDICLDPFPQNGGVSTFEPLHMGVPVVTKLGNGSASRLGAAIVTAAGLPDWVGIDDEQYIDIALRPTLEQLARIRRELPDALQVHCGTEPYTRAVETAYRTMWQTYCASPDDALPRPSGGSHSARKQRRR